MLAIIGDAKGIPGLQSVFGAISDGLRSHMVSSTVAPILNTFLSTAFAQNVGLVATSGIKSRFAVALGGAGIVLVGSVAASGVRTLSRGRLRRQPEHGDRRRGAGVRLIPVVAIVF